MLVESWYSFAAVSNRN